MQIKGVAVLPLANHAVCQGLRGHQVKKSEIKPKFISSQRCTGKARKAGKARRTRTARKSRKTADTAVRTNHSGFAKFELLYIISLSLHANRVRPAHRVRKDRPDHLATLDRQEHPEILAKTQNLDRRDQRVRLDRPENLDIPGYLEIQECRHSASPLCQENRGRLVRTNIFKSYQYP